ncbi:MAG: ABC transporter substrate-binding protein, partial [Anaerolineae bacterium]
MKKTFSALAALVMILSLVLACGPTPEPQVVEKIVTQEVEKEVKVVETVEVEKEVTVIQTVEVEKEVVKEVEKQVEKDLVIYNSYQSDPEPREADAALVSMFEEENPNIDVVHSTVAHEDFKQAIRAYLTASTPPDVMTWFAGNRARFFIDKGLIMDISDVWESEGWNESFPAGFRALSTVDGKQYFLPSSWYWWAVYYRTDIFEQYGLEPPETWEEFLQVCETLKENGIAPITIGTKYRWTAAA